MKVTMLKGKIHRATVVQAELDYVGSITVDQDLLDAAGILEYEKVQIVDVNNGSILINNKDYKTITTKIDDREAIIVIPDKPNGKWALKTEYFGAFPSVEIELLDEDYDTVDTTTLNVKIK